MATIELSRGHVSEIDDADAEVVAAYSWHVFMSGRCMYARAFGKGSKNSIFMHRLLLNAPKGVSVDHIDNNGLNNRRSNLRLCTTAENNANQRKRLAPTTSKYKGVSANRDSYRTTIVVRQVTRGFSLPTEFEAAMAYDVLALSVYGQFANTNFTPGEHIRHRQAFPAFWEMVEARLRFLDARDDYQGLVTRSGKTIVGQRDALAAYRGDSDD